MEQNQTLFDMQVDSQSKSFLAESARWGKFLSIIGFIVCGLIVLAGVFVATQANELDRAFREAGSPSRFSSMSGAVLAVFYIIIAVLYFFPCLYLFRFSNHMKLAINANDQQRLVVAFMNLKSMFKFVGVLTIIIISIYILAFVIGIASRG